MGERWARTKELFTRALELEAAERGVFLMEACGADDALRFEVESLLRSHDRADSFLDTPAAAPWPPVLGLNMVGRLVGDYRVIREAGRGGSSIVYLAQRADQQFQRRVAIKMLRGVDESADVLQRFRNERQTLAELDHPNIVTLLDGGTTEEGMPYLVMDFVEGVPIDQYCDSRRLRIRDRLQIFRTVCDSVEYAHRKGVIHRDLKPSNILVTQEGTPQLLDFGIAKLLDPGRFSLTTMVTLIGTRAMTPEYASPEQVRGQPVTAATDIYSLGVLLYVLLCGHPPYRAKGSSLLDVERIVCEQEPVRPSIAALRNDGQEPGDGEELPQLTAGAVAAARDQRPTGLGRELRGDLDAIAMKALSKEPHRRYPSAAEFSEDIGRHLSGMPVTARRSRVGYRSGKFVARHRESLAVALIILAAAGVVVAWQLQRSRAAATDHTTVNAPAGARPSVAVLELSNTSRREDTAWLATALSEMLNSELAAGGRLRLLPGDRIARAQIELALPDATDLSAGNLKAVHRMLDSDFVVSGSYVDLGARAGGQIHLDLHLHDAASGTILASVAEQGSEAQLFDIVARAGTRLRARLGVSEARAAESAAVQVSMPSTTEAAKLYSEGLAKLRGFDALRARDLLSRAAVVEPAFSLTHAALAKAWLALGYAGNARQEAAKAMDTAGGLSREDRLLVEGQYHEANQDWGHSIEAYATLFNFFPDNPEYGLALANAEIKAGRSKDALVTLQKVHGLSRDMDQDPRIDLALAYAASLASDNARQASTAASAAGKARLTGATLMVAAARSLQCRALANMGEATESAAACKEARGIYESAGDWSGAANTLHNMAEVPLNQGNLQLAQALYEQALGMVRRIGDGRGITRELVGLSVISHAQGAYDKTEQLMRDTLGNCREIVYTLCVAGEELNLANVLREQTRMREALELYRDSLAVAKEIGNTDIEAMDSMGIGTSLADQGDLGDAVREYEETLNLQQQHGERSNYALTLVSLGRVRLQQGDAAAARALYGQALTIQRELGEKGSLAETQVAEAELMCDADQAGDAANLAQSALHEFQVEKKNSDEILAHEILARALLRESRITAAREAINAALALAEHGSTLDRLGLQLDDARVHAAEKDFSGAERLVQQVLGAAQKQNLVRLKLGAWLVLGEIMAAGPDAAHAPAELRRLEASAQAKGFGLIARQAAALGARPSVPL
jgi:serine/threonine protein kinase/tetratricopeptide (TPR) repeat protein/TolB-like protein